MFPKVSIQVRREPTLHDTLYKVYRRRTDGHYWLGDTELASCRSQSHAVSLAEKYAADEKLPLDVLVTA
jgi:hypothetical protein